MRKFLAFSLIIGVLSCFFVATPALCASTDSSNLLQNGDFSLGDGNSIISGWSQHIFDGEGSHKHIVSGSSDAPYVSVTSKNGDYRLIQTVNAKPNTTYKFSGYIKTDGLENKNNVGAILSLTYTQDFTEPVYNTQGKWKYVEMFIITDDKKTYFDVSIGIGGHSSVNSGTAYFKDIKLEEYTGKINEFKQTVCRTSQFSTHTSNQKNPQISPDFPNQNNHNNDLEQNIQHDFNPQVVQKNVSQQTSYVSIVLISIIVVLSILLVIFIILYSKCKK